MSRKHRHRCQHRPYCSRIWRVAWFGPRLCREHNMQFIAACLSAMKPRTVVAKFLNRPYDGATS